MSVVAWTSFIVAILTGLGWLVLVASSMSGTPLSAILQGGVLGIVLTQTQFGQVWVLRGLFVLVLAICLALQRSNAKQLAGWVGLLAAGALMASLAWAGHGAATQNLPWEFLHLPADILHLLATGAWLGALVPLALFLATLRREGTPESVTLAWSAVTRFSVLGITCVGTILVTGIVNTWFLSGSIPALVGTLYGQLLLLKVAFYAGMIGVASVNKQRLTPMLNQAKIKIPARVRAVRKLSRNALTEASLGILVLGIVGIIGTLPPGLHTEPRWPFPFTFELSELAAGARNALDTVVVAFVLCLIAIGIFAGLRKYGWMTLAIVAFIVCDNIGWAVLRPGIVRAYPTTYYASTQAYAAPSIARGAPVYLANCAECHGVLGRGNGPLAARLPVRPADLTEPHIFAHSVGNIFWWVSNGIAGSPMPGFAGKLTPDQRWDVINFVLARAASVQTNAKGSQISAAAAPLLPDFTYEQQGAQNSLSQSLKKGPVLLVLFELPTPPDARIEQLNAAGVRVIAVDLSRTFAEGPFTAGVSADVRATLSLFRSSADGGETELLLDRNGGVRARWTNTVGLADSDSLAADAERVAKIPAAAASHAGHAH